MIEIIEEATEKPICPHCEQSISKILANKIKSTFGVRYLYFCSKCRKTLGISHRKGFWMG
ncbi:hypothetical protein [Aliikangiella coralliicola]|uniref:Uncharacterized protein n=1 Tax=Aliikangiella coralliicola TaxID=2592383 RepID=A0A545UAJ6_9GAMM|nr:hypothetical protein [Aliikangiella coralliicola]TQV86495.1 hypothetical protein FLL46_16415 [Aliikangiella coralliicola]